MCSETAAKDMFFVGAPETDKGQTYCDVWYCDVVDDWSYRGHVIWKWKKVTLSDHIPCDDLISLCTWITHEFIIKVVFILGSFFSVSLILILKSPEMYP